jgi:hypothetical protein
MDVATMSNGNQATSFDDGSGDDGEPTDPAMPTDGEPTDPTMPPTGAPQSGPSSPCTISQRAQLFGNGVLNLALAAGKISAAAGVEAGTSGIGTVLALYGVYSAAGNAATGFIQIVGAFSSSPGQFQQAAAVGSVAGSVAGLTTLVATNGNLTAASHAARFEGFALFGLRSGSSGSVNPLSAAGNTVNAAKEAGIPIGCHWGDLAWISSFSLSLDLRVWQSFWPYSLS